LSSATFALDTDTARPARARAASGGLHVSKPGDPLEVEADHVADTVVSGGRLPAWSLARSGFGTISRQAAAAEGGSARPAASPQSSGDILGKLAEAFLATKAGQHVVQMIEGDPVVKGATGFATTPAGFVVTGSAALGAVAALAATHKPLPVQIPSVPLDRLYPGLSLKISYAGPVDHPTSATLALSFHGKPPVAHGKQSESEKYRAETARIAADQEKFRAGLLGGAGVGAAQPGGRSMAEDSGLRRLAAVAGLGGKRPADTGAHAGAALPGLRMPTLESPLKVRPPTLLDKKLELKPVPSGAPAADQNATNATNAKKREEFPLQRKAEASGEILADPALIDGVLRSPGRPLESETRRFMERRIGFDFGRVRLHTDARAAASARALSAKAYTVGSDVVFAAGRYAPGTTEGRRLLAHELTHVVQQSHQPARSPLPASLHASLHASPSPRQIQRDAEEENADSGSGSWFSNPADKIRGFIRKIPGFRLFTVIIGKDPLTEKPVEQNASNLLGALFNLVPGGDDAFKRIQESGALQKAYKWITDRLDELGLNWGYFKGLVETALHSLNLRDFASPGAAAQRIIDMFKPAFDKVKIFASEAADKVLEFAMEAALAAVNGTGILETLRNAREAFRTIVKDPVGFLKNLIEALKQGFDGFKDHIADHLKNSVAELLFGAVARAGIKLPKSFGLGEIIGLVLQVLDLTYDKFRTKMVAVLGEDAVHFLEGSFDFLMKLAQAKSLAGAWKMIIEKADQLIDTVLDGVKSWAITKIVGIAIVKLAALFNPVGAIVQAIQVIYKTINFFIEKAQQLKAIVDAIVKSLSNIAAGRLSDAAAFVEKAMASGMTAIIGFLAEQFGLGDIGKQVRAIIDSVRAKVDKALDKIVEYIVAKGKSFYEKGKAAVGRVLAWWQQRKDVLVGEEEHSIYMEGTEDAPRIMIASAPAKFWSDFLNAQPPHANSTLLEKAKKLAGELEKPLSSSSTPEEKAKNVKTKQDQFNQFADLIVKLGFSQKHTDPASVIKYDETLTPEGGGTEATASVLSKKHPQGTPPRDSAPIWKNLAPLVQRRNYVQGHLLNENLGGPGRRFNLTPINKKANANHHAKIEAKVKEMVEAGKVVFYSVHAEYGTHAVEPARFKELKNKKASGLSTTEDKEIQAYETEQKLCTSFKCEAYELVFDGKQWTRPATPPTTQPTIAPAQEHVVIEHNLEP
jgi:hypothetical protein